MREPHKYFADSTEQPPFLKAQAIIVAIDQYAEAATGNREFFWNKPHSIGGNRKSGDIP